MRTRTALVAAAALLAGAGSLTPALAGTVGGGVVKGTWTASASPDPTGENPVSGLQCDPTIPTGRTTMTFAVPGPGTLDVSINNKLDWSGDVRDKDNEVLASADGGGPTDLEQFSTSFKKKQTVTIGACNLEGEPSVDVTYTFTPKKKK